VSEFLDLPVLDVSRERVGRIRDLVRRMEKDAAEDVTELLVHDEETAGGMMGTEDISFPPSLTVAEAFARPRVLAKEAELSTDVFVVGPHEELLGSLSLRDLLAADDDATLEQVMRAPARSVPAEPPAKDVIELVAKVDGLELPVTGIDDGHVNGRFWNVVAWSTTGVMGILTLALVVTTLFPSLGARH
jgi:Mg/Co/Ni transporter MgtE